MNTCFEPWAGPRCTYVALEDANHTENILEYNISMYNLNLNLNKIGRSTWPVLDFSRCTKICCLPFLSHFALPLSPCGGRLIYARMYESTSASVCCASQCSHVEIDLCERAKEGRKEGRSKTKKQGLETLKRSALLFAGIGGAGWLFHGKASHLVCG